MSKINMAKWSQAIIDAKDVRNLPVLYFPVLKNIEMGVIESVNDERIAAQSAEQFVHHVRHRKAGEIQTHNTQSNEHDGNSVVPKYSADIEFFTKINHGNHLRIWSEHTE